MVEDVGPDDELGLEADYGYASAVGTDSQCGGDVHFVRGDAVNDDAVCTGAGFEPNVPLGLGCDESFYSGDKGGEQVMQGLNGYDGPGLGLEDADELFSDFMELCDDVAHVSYGVECSRGALYGGLPLD